MDGHQRRNLIKVIETITIFFARYSQQPGTGWPEQEWVLLQLTKINGVGDKCPNSHRSKMLMEEKRALLSTIAGVPIQRRAVMDL
jgi:hypothetical protein